MDASHSSGSITRTGTTKPTGMFGTIRTVSLEYSIRFDSMVSSTSTTGSTQQEINCGLKELKLIPNVFVFF
jgi:hypothetical protein